MTTLRKLTFTLPPAAQWWMTAFFMGVVFSPMLWLKLVPRTLRGMPRQWNNTRPPLPIAWRGGQIVPVPDWVKRIDEQPMPY